MKRLSLFIIACCLMVACSGDDASNSTSNPQASSRTSQPDTPVLDEDAEDLAEVIGSEMYNRPVDYPKSVNLPMQFITTLGGKKLSVRVTLPADENGDPAPGPFPTILTQSAYNTNLLSYVFLGTPGNILLGVSDPFMVKRGYAQVAVDALGTGASEGGWELLGEDEQIGFADAVDWAQQQPWSNGKIGVAGVSYMAISSLFAAQRRPDSIDAVFASLPMGDAMRGTVGVGGLLNGLFMSTWMTLTHTTATQNVPAILANPQHAAQLMATTDEHVAQVDRYYLPLIENALNGAPQYTYDGDFWRLRSPLQNIDKIKAPTFILGALHDIFQRDEPLLFERLASNGVDARLVIYNGTHFINFVVPHIGSEQVPAVDFLLLQWFDKHLKGMDTGTENIPAVVQHVKNYPTKSTPAEFQNDSYATATQWPHPLLSPQRWYLRGDGSLTKSPPENVEPSFTMSNPEHPVGGAHNSNGLLVFELIINDGTECSRSFEQWTLGLTLPKACFSNSDKTQQERVVFDSDVMAEDYYINGPIQADIWIDSTVTEAVVSVQIEELSDSQSLPITNGQLLASGRLVDVEKSRFIHGEMIQPYHSFSEASSQPLVPGEVVKMQIEIFPTSAIIRKGNKLRVSISPSNQAQSMLNYPRQALAEGGVTTIHNSPQYPSSVVLPIVPLNALN